MHQTLHLLEDARSKHMLGILTEPNLRPSIQIMDNEMKNRDLYSYLAAKVLSQPWSAGGALIDDRLFGAEDREALCGIFFILSVYHQATHLHQTLTVILMVIRSAILIPAKTWSLR